MTAKRNEWLDIRTRLAPTRTVRAVCDLTLKFARTCGRFLFESFQEKPMQNIPLAEWRERERESSESAVRRMCIWERLHLFSISYLRTGFWLEKQLFFKLGRYPACKKKKEDGTACTDRKMHELQLGPLHYWKTTTKTTQQKQRKDNALCYFSRSNVRFRIDKPLTFSGSTMALTATSVCSTNIDVFTIYFHRELTWSLVVGW